MNNRRTDRVSFLRAGVLILLALLPIGAVNVGAGFLAERELMGRRVSHEARRSITEAADDHGSQGGGWGDGAIGLGRNRECLVVFLGVPDFESWYKRLEPVRLFAALSDLTALLCEAIHAEGGDVDKVLGDTWLVSFTRSDGPEAEVTAARRLIDRLRRLDRDGRLPIPLAAGISRGTVIAGRLGAGDRCDHTLIGDPVDTAARTEGEAEKLPADRFLMTATDH